MKLTDEEIEQRLANVPGWEVEEGSLAKEFVFKDFEEAFKFMAAAAVVAEELNHHPDWSNSYKKVMVHLSTHEERGITDLDFELAGKMNRLARK
jgi:4a-hydroxytetrahydrobiopterin dehydratase